MMRCMKLLLSVALSVAAALAQGPLTAEAKASYNTIKNNLLKTADKVPEDLYSFKPTPEVRSLGQLIGHVADAQIMMCGAARGEKHEPLNAEKTKTSKADLVAALQESFKFCDGAYDVTDAKAADMVKLFGRDRSRLGTLYFNVAHDNEHYGNLVTYMRLKGIVPPSSEGRR